MAEPNLDKSNVASPLLLEEPRHMPRIVWLLLVLATISVGGCLVTTYYVGEQRQAEDGRGALARESCSACGTDQILAYFGFSARLPSFEEKNVVQAFSRSVDFSASSSRPTMIYYVFGQTLDSIRDAYEAYFSEMGWRRASDTQESMYKLSFQAPDPQTSAAVFLSDIAGSVSTNTTMVVLSVRKSEPVAEGATPQ